LSQYKRFRFDNDLNFILCKLRMILEFHVIVFMFVQGNLDEKELQVSYLVDKDIVKHLLHDVDMKKFFLYKNMYHFSRKELIFSQYQI